jgi:acylphosphatase
VIRRRVIVSGRVQGVFFRDTISGEARARQVAGAITNRDDGRVEAVFEGDPDDVEALIELCRTGPERAVVEDVQVLDEEPEGLEGFRIT